MDQSNEKVDYTKLTYHELVSVGVELMKASLRNLHNPDAPEHEEFDRYAVELEKRNSFNN